MTDDDPDAQDREIGDFAADMREHGRSWAHIAHDLALPEATVKLAAAQAHNAPPNSPPATKSLCSEPSPAPRTPTRSRRDAPHQIPAPRPTPCRRRHERDGE